MPQLAAVVWLVLVLGWHSGTGAGFASPGSLVKVVAVHTARTVDKARDFQALSARKIVLFFVGHFYSLNAEMIKKAATNGDGSNPCFA